MRRLESLQPNMSTLRAIGSRGARLLPISVSAHGSAWRFMEPTRPRRVTSAATSAQADLVPQPSGGSNDVKETVGVLENFIDQAEKRAWFLYDSRSSEPTLNRGGNMSGWRLIGLYVYCVLLTGLATAFAAAFATAPYWIWPALKSASAWFL